jgi:hypothetical protein
MVNENKAILSRLKFKTLDLGVNILDQKYPFDHFSKEEVPL